MHPANNFPLRVNIKRYFGSIDSLSIEEERVNFSYISDILLEQTRLEKNSDMSSSCCTSRKKQECNFIKGKH